jgi:hypothetical protein
MGSVLYNGYLQGNCKRKKFIPMDHKKRLEELRKEAFEKLEEYVKAKGELEKEHHDKLQEAKVNWENAWNKLIEVLMVLERLEI